MKKDFDCVQMKNDIQKELLREIAGLSLEERLRRNEEIISKDPLLGPFWERTKKTKLDE